MMSNLNLPQAGKLELKTLGRGVALGELYDSRTSQFLGVQLCPNSTIDEITDHTNEPDFKLEIKSSKTFESRINLLHVEAQLSADILSGIVSVSGSGSYVNDTKSNSEEYSWGLAVFTRAKTASFSPYHSKVQATIGDTNVIKDYKSRATHVVTTVVYGGDMIINLVAKEESKAEDSKLEGKLNAKLNNLGGWISAEGKISVDHKNQFSTEDKQLDIVIHADAAIDQVPVDLLSVFEMLPGAFKKLKEEPVPISVVLHPIPKYDKFPDFDKSGFIRDLEISILDNIKRDYDSLLDIRNRFIVLQESASTNKDYIPALLAAINKAGLSFQGQSAGLLGRLARYINAYKSEQTTSDIDKLLEDVRTAIEGQRPVLVGLEEAHQSFVRLTLVINKFYHITSLPDLRKLVVANPIVALLIIPPLPPKPDQVPDRVIKAFLMDSIAYYGTLKPPVTVYALYAEDLGIVDDAMRGNGKFKELKSVSLYLGQKKMGEIFWTPVLEKDIADAGDQLYDLRPNHKQNPDKSHNTLQFFTNNMSKIDATKSFTFVLRCQYQKDTTQKTGTLGQLLIGNVTLRLCYRQKQLKSHTIDYLDVNVFVSQEQRGYLVDAGSDDVKELPDKEDFYCALVQDIEKSPKKWILYFNGGESVGAMDIPSDGVELSESATLESAEVPGPKYLPGPMRGMIYNVHAFNHALNPLQLAVDSGGKTF